jgi:hypothetical protein
MMRDGRRWLEGREEWTKSLQEKTISTNGKLFLILVGLGWGRRQTVLVLMATVWL